MTERDSTTGTDDPAAAVPPSARSDRSVRVAVPAALRFAPVARIAVSGLAIRLGFDVGDVEQLRLAVAAAANALVDQPSVEPAGELTVTATWDDRRFGADLLLTPPTVASETIERIERELRPLLSASLVADVAADGVRFSLDPTMQGDTGEGEPGAADTDAEGIGAATDAEMAAAQPELPNP
ncbi:MAG: hypothetical protein ACRBI6_03165 [Acidimicrobiales bacterium]